MASETNLRLEAELEALETTALPAAQDEVKVAQGAGDITENTDVPIALAELARVRNRIRQIKAALANPVLVEDAPDGQVAMGRLVTLSFGSDPEETFLFGSVEDRHPDFTTLSLGSPVGRAIDGCHTSDVVEVDFGSMVERVTIVKVSPLV
jgi:transcription elongation GreA/GreB family factor